MRKLGFFGLGGGLDEEIKKEREREKIISIEYLHTKIHPFLLKIFLVFDLVT